MRQGSIVLAGLMMMALAAGWGAAPALAKPKCPKACKQEFATQLKSCKTSCKSETDKTVKKACRKACVTTNKSEKSICKAATNPVPPSCSPSGAFLD